MKLRFLLLLCVCVAVAAAKAKNWALLFTGSRGFDNYSTHSNLCHAYHVLHDAGIPEERIVVIMYNDVAGDPDNPFPGQLFNNYSHIDVLQGTPLDYTGSEITADLILAVLQGDREGVKRLIGRVGKVIDSGPEDNVFVGVSGHGVPGVIIMPDGGNNMTAGQLQGALKSMYDNKKYAKLVFYLETCEGGSIFEGLPDDLNIYAFSATNGTDPCYQNYCFDPAFGYITCLGGCFSTAWLENTERMNLETFTFGEQSMAVKKTVNDSEPQLFGDMSILKLPLNQFFAGQHAESSESSSAQTVTSAPQGQKSSVRRRHATAKDTAPVHTMKLTLLKRKAEKFPQDTQVKVQLERLKTKMAAVDNFFYQVAKSVYPVNGKTSRIVAHITSSRAEPIRNWDCYEAAMDAVSVSCSGLLRHSDVQSYFLSKYSVLVNLCNRETGSTISRAVMDVAKVTKLC